MKILHYDLETAPTMAYIWKLWKENIGVSQVLEPGRVICWCAKWDGEDDIYGMTEHHDGGDDMIEGLYEMMNEADVIVAYNGNNFDRPVMNAEFVKRGYTPPTPTKQVDLYQVVKKNFRFLSNRLDFVVKALGHPDGKAETGGFDLWARCLEGDAEAWEQMLEYNAQDVEILEWLYHRLLPWVPNHPNHALYTPTHEHACPSCGSTSVQSRGLARTTTMTYRRFRCNECGTWSRERISDKEALKPKLVRDNTK